MASTSRSLSSPRIATPQVQSLATAPPTGPPLTTEYAGPSTIPARSNDRSCKREQVSSACSTCRQGKSKCDAVRPSCNPCRARGSSCYYDTEPGVTRTASLKRKHDAMHTETERMWQILQAIQSSSPTEVADMVQQIRRSSDCSDVLHELGKQSTTAGRILSGRLSGVAAPNTTRQPIVPAHACQACTQRNSSCDMRRLKCGRCRSLHMDCGYGELLPLSKDEFTAKVPKAVPDLESKTGHAPSGKSIITPDAVSSDICTPLCDSPSKLSFRVPDIGDSYPSESSQRTWQPNLSVSTRVLLWPEIVRHIRESSLVVTLSDFHCLMRLGTPWMLRRETSGCTESLPCDVGLESVVLGSGSLSFPSLTIQQVHEFSAAYFTTFNTLLPLLDPNTFMDEVVPRLLREGYMDDDPEGILALLVFALGQLAIEGVFDRSRSAQYGGLSGFRGGTIGRPPGLRIFNEARRRIGMVATRSRLEHVQILLLQATYFEATARHSDFWSSLTAASMACMYLIRGHPIDWSSLYGDLVKRAYWTCVFHERLFDVDLRVGCTGIEGMEDQVPLPAFIAKAKSDRQWRISVLACSDNSSDNEHNESNDCAYHFYAAITLSRVIRRADAFVHGYEHTVGTIEPLWQENKNRDCHGATAAVPCWQQYTGPPSNLVEELARQLESWRASLPHRLQWSDDDNFDFAKFGPTTSSIRTSLSNKLRDMNRDEADRNVNIAMAQLRTRYYHARFLVYRPFIYKALHARKLMTPDDRINCAYAIKAACSWPICLSPPKDKKHLVPHLFSWTQNFLAILPILRLCQRNGYMGVICRDGSITNADLERSILKMIEWLEDVRQLDGIADWSMRVFDFRTYLPSVVP